MFFDSHAHINHEEYSPEARAQLARSIELSDVGFVVDVGFDLNSSAQAVADAAQYDWCYAAVGVHPHDAAEMNDEILTRIEALAAAPKVVAIGEIGLDFFRNISPEDDQRYWFRKQIRLGLKLGLPILIHDRDSAGETIRILTEEGALSDMRRSVFPPNPVTGIPDARILLHCYSGTADEALLLIEQGATISLAGPVTYKKNTKTAEVAARVPLSHLLIETDAPYLSPEPFRGKPNSSPFVVHTAQKIADFRGVARSEIEETTCANACRFFGIDRK
ncbi:MAG: TatD family hydrolase [Clostridiales Family XIII bacterium]|jgi:TatD DNase family protein|nr:TatD family hydrolase [Clostridiales Family XIII bacterium]